MEEKKTKKRHNATITFSRKEQKEEMLQHLNSVQLQNLMPDDVKKTDCLKVLWAVEYLHRLAIEGKMRVQVPMFEEDSQEKQGLLDEISRLKKRVGELEALEDGYIDTVNAIAGENKALEGKLAKIRKSVKWTAEQVVETPEYADELIKNLLSEVGS